MKKIISILSLTVLFTLFSNSVNAQDGYTYTLVDNGNYSYTISAVPNASASNFATSVQSYGFTIILPDGETASITSSLGNGASGTFFNGNDVGEPTIDGYLITETLGSPIALPAPSTGTVSPMVTIQMNTPMAPGTISLLANDSPLATSVTPLKSFMSADMVDDGMAMFTPVVDSVGSGLSGTTSHNFSTLSTIDFEFSKNEIKLYPNPTSGFINIQTNTTVESVAIYNLLGKHVLQTNLKTIDVSRLSEGIYILKITSDQGAQITKRFIKQ
ncbi:hypothetical protein IMCC3317_39340 [Kordia antarctica]|uniref:Secretion system C-terminal sorting domain-containing protein n=1 Tax=Kordia antarctica TaxID=1218801 RepID=A0A7L4ZPU0_9FLAO|nr:T9SS type A sorting domain-containing protein [Kordia antarctica]QHI38541.1 hypothetical protein IMCC3317_39340 [Kordia antarctica]